MGVHFPITFWHSHVDINEIDRNRKSWEDVVIQVWTQIVGGMKTRHYLISSTKFRTVRRRRKGKRKLWASHFGFHIWHQPADRAGDADSHPICTIPLCKIIRMDAAKETPEWAEWHSRALACRHPSSTRDTTPCLLWRKDWDLGGARDVSLCKWPFIEVWVSAIDQWEYRRRLWMFGNR